MNTVERKEKSLLEKFLSIRGMGQVLTATVGLIIIIVVFGTINPTFFKAKNVSNLLRQIAPILLIGIGQSYVLITGNIDLSIGSVVGMSCMFSATLMTKGVNPVLAIIITLLCCVIVGVANGQLVAFCKLPPFIATLGTMSICRGFAQLANNNYNTDLIPSAADGFRTLFYQGKTLGLFNSVWITIVLWACFFFLLSKTKTGRHLYAAGSNVEAARLSGVNIVSTTTVAYVVSALCACIVGLITCAMAGVGTMDAGTSYEMFAVAAAVIGGVSVLGGYGNIIGTIVGASIWAVLQNGLQFADAPVAYKSIIIGIIVIGSVLADVIVRSKKITFKKA